MADYYPQNPNQFRFTPPLRHGFGLWLVAGVLFVLATFTVPYTVQWWVLTVSGGTAWLFGLILTLRYAVRELWADVQERAREGREIGLLNVNLMAYKYQMELETLRSKDMRIVQQLTRDQLAYIKIAHAQNLFEITGNRVSWIVNGMRIPTFFAEDWMEKWGRRGRAEQLPADHDWDREPQRDTKQGWNRAIRTELIQMGLVYDVSGGRGSRYPARFIEDPARALAQIGLWTALVINDLFKTYDGLQVPEQTRVEIVEGEDGGEEVEFIPISQESEEWTKQEASTSSG